MAESTIEERAPWPGFGVGWMIGTSLSVWLATLLVWLPVMVVAFLPFALLRVWWVDRLWSEIPLSGASEVLLHVLNWVTLLGGSTVTSAVLCYAVVRRLQGQRVALAEALRRGFARLPHAFGLGLVFVAVGAALALLLRWLQAEERYLIFFLCAIPALWLFVVWAIALPAAVTESLPVGAALRRSATLTRRRRGWLFMAWFLLLLILWVPIGLVIGPIETPRVRVWDAETQATWAAHARRRVWLVTGTFGLTCSLMAVSVGVAYFGLRRDRDGTTFDELVKAFE